MNGLKVRATSRFARPRRRHYWGTTALAITLMVPAAALASARVSGSAQSMSVNAENSSIKEVLSALSKQFKLRFESSATLDKQITGTYQGSLQGVVARLLEGYNFFITTNQGVLVVTVLGTQNGQTIAGTQSTVGRVAAVPAQPQKTSTFAQVQNSQGAQTPQATQPPRATAGTSPSPIAEKAAPGTAAPASSDSAAPPLLLKVAEGPMPVPGASTVAGPVPKPSTAAMPTPTTSGTAPSISPTPTSAANSVTLPMPTSSTPFPGMNTPTTAPDSSPAPSAPTTQKP